MEVMKVIKSKKMKPRYYTTPPTFIIYLTLIEKTLLSNSRSKGLITLRMLPHGNELVSHGPRDSRGLYTADNVLEKLSSLSITATAGRNTSVHGEHGVANAIEPSNATSINYADNPNMPERPMSRILKAFVDDSSRKRWELKEIAGALSEFCMHRRGSLLVQRRLGSGTVTDISNVFHELLAADIMHILEDRYGNYVIRRLFEVCSSRQYDILFSKLRGRFLRLSLHSYGHHVLTTVIATSSTAHRDVFIRELGPYALYCCTEERGCHVIRAVLRVAMDDSMNGFRDILDHIYMLSTNARGVLIVLQCLTSLSDRFRSSVISVIQMHAIELMQDSVGTGVVQFILEHGSTDDKEPIMCSLRGQVINMAMHKSASIVCEKALTHGSVPSVRALIAEMIFPSMSTSAESPLATMMKDEYAHSVLQTAACVSQRVQAEWLITQIRSRILFIRRNPPLTGGVYSPYETKFSRWFAEHDSLTHSASV